MGDSQLGLYVKDFKVRTLSSHGCGRLLGDEGLQNGIRAKVSSFLRHHVDSGMTKAKICGNYVNSIFAKKRPYLRVRRGDHARTEAMWPRRVAKTSSR